MNPGTVLQHYKKLGSDEGYYIVICEATDVVSKETLILYRNQKNTNWLRPKSMFSDVVDHKGLKLLRFVEVGSYPFEVPRLNQIPATHSETNQLYVCHADESGTIMAIPMTNVPSEFEKNVDRMLSSVIDGILSTSPEGA